ncbi:MAG TPA: hypothetical protein V6C65_04650 [Allocoleopsis sp.]
MQIDENSGELMELYLQIQQVEEVAKQLSQTQGCRELDFSITNLQQARLWLTEALANNGNFKTT